MVEVIAGFPEMGMSIQHGHGAQREIPVQKCGWSNSIAVAADLLSRDDKKSRHGSPQWTVNHGLACPENQEQPRIVGMWPLENHRGGFRLRIPVVGGYVVLRLRAARLASSLASRFWSRLM